MTSKRCPVCKTWKVLNLFALNRTEEDGHHSFCRECKRTSDRTYWKRHNVSIRTRRRTARENTHARAKKIQYNKRYYQEHKSDFATKRVQYKLRYPEREAAKNLIREAIRKGQLVKPSVCSSCGEALYKITAHHPDYRKPFKVIWLCTKCHKREHYKL